ncbi:MAG: methyltransferase domain-containing protein [Alphaproteobacteria bacterium]|nr:methyltransferase domain-containing protein [Alphaproteobacteria bacterium]
MTSSSERTEPDRHASTSQHWDPQRYARNAGFVAELGQPVIEWLAPVSGEHVLDLGCGDGALTEKLAELGLDVLGVDASPQQVAACRARGLNAEVLGGEALGTRPELAGRFDAVFSNAALHWMKAPAPVIAGVAHVLKSGGRFVGEFGGAGNVATVKQALEAAVERRGFSASAIDPWYFPTPEAYRAELEAGGFAVERMELFERPTPLPGPLEDWLDTFGESYLNILAEQDRPAVKAEVAEAVRSRLLDASGTWSVDYVRLRFAARRMVP